MTREPKQLQADIPFNALALSPETATRDEPLSESQNLLYYWHAVLKRKWSILSIAFIAAIIAAFNSYSKQPIYKATAYLLLDPYTATAMSPLKNSLDGSSVYYQNLYYFNNQKAIISSDAFLSYTADRLSLTKNELTPSTESTKLWMNLMPQQIKDFLQAFSAPAEPVQSAPDDPELIKQQVIASLSGINMELQEGSHVVSLSYQSADPAIAARITNEIAQAYIDYGMETRLENYRNATSWLTERTQDLRQDLQESESQLQQYRENAELVNIEGGRDVVESQLQNTFERLISAQSQLSEIKTIYDEIEAIKAEPMSVASKHPVVLQNEAVKAAYTATTTAQLGVNDLSSRYGPKHPQMREAKDTLSLAQASLAKEVNIYLNNISKEYELAQRRVSSLKQEFESLKDQSKELNRKYFTVNNLKQEVDINRELYDLFVQKFKETDIGSEINSPTARVINPARVPSAPVWPNPPRDIAKAFLIALVAGIALALLLEFMDNTVRSQQQMEEKLGVTHLVSLPLLTGKHDVPEQYFLTETGSAFAEATRTLRTAVLLSSLDDPHRIVALTSTVPSEGKTTVAINLALALSQIENVLLIDADLRGPSVGAQFGIDKDAPGLSNLAAGTASNEDCIFKHPDSNLHVLPAGLVPPNPQELLSSKRFHDLLINLAENYDRIVIDTPPNLAVSDAMLIAPWVSAMVYVVKAGSTTTPLIRDSLRRLRQIDAPIIGAVLNQADPRRDAKRYGYAKYYNRYYGQTPEQQKA